MFVDGTTDFEMTRGDNESIKVSLKNYQLSNGDVVRLTVRKSPRSQEITLQKVVTEFDDNGKAIIKIAPEDTADLPWGMYFYDIEITFKTGIKKTFVRPSMFRILWEVTY